MALPDGPKALPGIDRDLLLEQQPLAELLAGQAGRADHGKA